MTRNQSVRLQNRKSAQLNSIVHVEPVHDAVFVAVDRLLGPLHQSRNFFDGLSIGQVAQN